MYLYPCTSYTGKANLETVANKSWRQHHLLIWLTSLGIFANQKWWDDQQKWLGCLQYQYWANQRDDLWKAPLQWLPTKAYQNLTIEVEPFSGFDRSLPFEGFDRFWSMVTHRKGDAFCSDRFCEIVGVTFSPYRLTNRTKNVNMALSVTNYHVLHIAC